MIEDFFSFVEVSKTIEKLYRYRYTFHAFCAWGGKGQPERRGVKRDSQEGVGWKRTTREAWGEKGQLERRGVKKDSQKGVG